MKYIRQISLFGQMSFGYFVVLDFLEFLFSVNHCLVVVVVVVCFIVSSYRLYGRGAGT